MGTTNPFHFTQDGVSTDPAETFPLEAENTEDVDHPTQPLTTLVDGYSEFEAGSEIVAPGSSGEVGIVLRYYRFPYTDANMPTDVNCWKHLGGVDRLFVKFADKHEWLDFYHPTRRIFFLSKVRGDVKMASGHGHSHFECGWVRFNELDHHLNFDCVYRPVWVPGEQDKALVGKYTQLLVWFCVSVLFLQA